MYIHTHLYAVCFAAEEERGKNAHILNSQRNTKNY